MANHSTIFEIIRNIFQKEKAVLKKSMQERDDTRDDSRKGWKFVWVENEFSETEEECPYTLKQFSFCTHILLHRVENC